MVDWVCGSLGGSLIVRLYLATLLHRLVLQTNLYCVDSGSKWHNLLKMAAALQRCIRFTFLKWKEAEMRFLQSMVQRHDSMEKITCASRRRPQNISDLFEFYTECYIL